MCNVIAITNQKGGVGKTTTAINLATSLVATRKRVLLIDFDPQGNATTGSGVTLNPEMPTAKEMLLGETPLQETIQQTAAGFDIVPSDRRLTVAEVKLLQMQQREYLLKQILFAVHSEYDYIFIDEGHDLSMCALKFLTKLAPISKVVIPK